VSKLLRARDIPAWIALVIGIAFSLLMTLSIGLLGDRLDAFELRPDRRIVYWYPWVSADPGFWTRLSVWSGYLSHQVAVWALIAYGQASKTRYQRTLGPVNLLALFANALFIILHLLQTHWFYDGLAVDVPEQGSQWSVIILLVLVLLMENQRRGLFLGKRVKARFVTEAARAVRKYHGYYFAWAIIYTFWYHPMVSTPGHLIGFLYMFLLLLQSSLFFTPMHVNRWWTLTLEVSVLFHGALVAYTQSPHAWPMFFFGFAGLFIITQMHGLGLSKGIRWIFFIAYVLGALWVYSGKGLAHLHQVTWIPITDYVVVFIVALLVWIGMRLFAGIQSLGASSKSPKSQEIHIPD
jgi:hypothetical protein